MRSGRLALTALTAAFAFLSPAAAQDDAGTTATLALPVACDRAALAAETLFRAPAHWSLQDWLLLEVALTDRGAGRLAAVQKDWLTDRAGAPRWWYLARAELRLARTAGGCAVRLQVLRPSAFAPAPPGLGDDRLWTGRKHVARRLVLRLLAEDLQELARTRTQAFEAPSVLLHLPLGLTAARRAAEDALLVEGFRIDQRELADAEILLEASLPDQVPARCASRPCLLPPQQRLAVRRARIRLAADPEGAAVRVTGLPVEDLDLGELGEYRIRAAARYLRPDRSAAALAQTLAAAAGTLSP